MMMMMITLEGHFQQARGGLAVGHLGRMLGGEAMASTAVIVGDHGRAPGVWHHQYFAAKPSVGIRNIGGTLEGSGRSNSSSMAGLGFHG